MNNEENNQLPEERITTPNNDFYHDDNSYNNQGINQEQNGQGVPNQNNRPMTNFAKDTAKGIKNGLNPNEKRNPALGGKSNKKPNEDKNNKPENNKRNPLPGGGTNKKADDKKNVSKAPNNPVQNKNSGLMSRFNPRNRMNGKPGDKAGKAAGNKAKEAGADGIKKGLSKGIKAIWKALPLQAKIVVIVSFLAIIIILLLILLIILIGGTTAAVTAAICGESEYGSNSNLINADATSFMCSMTDPLNGNYTVSSLYGWRAFDESHMHGGVDLAGKTGTPVVAVHDGTVVLATNSSQGYGNHIIIQHGESGFYTLYGHLSKINVQKGDTVQQGQTIGKRGNTGNSYGAHLHFEIRTGSENGTTVSPNPYFGYSDDGYDRCIDRSSTNIKNCDMDSSGAARKLGEDGVNQVCNLGGNYSNNGDNSSCCETSMNGGVRSTKGTLLGFIHNFEGNGGYCNGDSTKYKSYLVPGDRITIGYGVTADYLTELKSVGQCIAVSKVDAAEKKAIETKRNNIKGYFSGVNLNQYEEDAMTSMAYNGCGTYFKGIAKAVANDNYEEIWSAMKGCNNGLDGLKKRRKAEFALFVTGNYDIAAEYKQKSWTAAEYDDYDSENIMGQKGSGTASTCPDSTGDKSKVVEIAIRELEANQNASENKKCTSIKTYMQACGYTSGVHHYCAGFVTYVLKEAGVEEDIGLPSYSCMVSSFKKTTNGTYHKAGGSFVPEPGDIAIGNNSGHVMIVEKVEGETVHIIGGNQSAFNVNCPNNGAGKSLGNITRAQYPLKGSYINGYVSYTVSGNSTSSSRTSASKYKSYKKYHKIGTLKVGNMKKVATVRGGKGATIAQSMAIAGKYYLVGYSNRNNSMSSVGAYKVSNGKKVNINSAKLGHANGMAYDSKKDKVYVANLGYFKTYYTFSGSKAINGNSLSMQKKSLAKNVSTMAFDNTTNQLYTGTRNTISIYDSNLKLVKKFSTIRDNTKQDSGADNGIFYMVDAERLSYPKSASISLYRVADKAYLGTFKVKGPGSYELESVNYTGQGNKFAFLFYISPGTAYIYTGNIDM